MIRKMYRKCRDSDTGFLWALLRYGYYKMCGVNLFVQQRVVLRGKKNIDTSKGALLLGIDPCGFMLPHEHTLLNIKGKFVLMVCSELAVAVDSISEKGPE